MAITRPYSPSDRHIWQFLGTLAGANSKSVVDTAPHSISTPLYSPMQLVLPEFLPFLSSSCDVVTTHRSLGAFRALAEGPYQIGPQDEFCGAHARHANERASKRANTSELGARTSVSERHRTTGPQDRGAITAHWQLLKQ